ncbi:MAG: TatD family hydrolase [Candidatus Omnitrophica bacterium]|nr:TatD family hydrolase [Candidatus Omnitrophota bacterium]
MSGIQRNEVIQACKSYLLIDSSINISTSIESIALSQDNSSIYSALGFHPFCAKEFSSTTIDSFTGLISKHSKVVAIGEIGLDETADTPLDEQEKILKAYLALAIDKKLPVMLHNRISDARIFDILNNFYQTYEKIVFHCFSYDTRMLKRIIEKKGLVSFSLNILRKKPIITESLKDCPLESLFLETDSPYMKIAGRASTPADIKEVYCYAAKLKGIEQEKLEEVVLSNVKKFFSL